MHHHPDAGPRLLLARVCLALQPLNWRASSFYVEGVCDEPQIVVLLRGHTELRAVVGGGEGRKGAELARREVAGVPGDTHDLVGVVADAHNAQPHFPVLLDSDLWAHRRCQHRTDG
jgi:hypothetical protein